MVTNMFSSGRYLFSFVLIVFLASFGESTIEPLRNDKWVKVINKIGVDLHVHCKSKDDDLSVRLLHPNESFEFKFGVQFFGRTLFFCRFWWGNEAHWFDIYDDDRDFQRCYYKCWWRVQEFGPCLLDGTTGEYSQCSGWNKELRHLHGAAGSTQPLGTANDTRIFGEH